MAPGARDLKSMKGEVEALESELKLIQGAQSTKQSCVDIEKYVKENEQFDALIVKSPNNPYTGQTKGTGCCG